MEDLYHQDLETQSNQEPLDDLETTAVPKRKRIVVYPRKGLEGITIKEDAANELAITAILMNRLRRDLDACGTITQTPVEMPKHQRQEFAEIAKLAVKHEIGIDDLDEAVRIYKMYSELDAKTDPLGD